MYRLGHGKSLRNIGTGHRLCDPQLFSITHFLDGEVDSSADRSTALIVACNSSPSVVVGD